MTTFSEILSGFINHLVDAVGTRNTVEAYIPKIRDTFVPCLDREYRLKRIKGVSLEEFLAHSVDMALLASSAVEYLKNTQKEGRVSESAIGNFLIAVKQFFLYLDSINIKNDHILDLLMDKKRKSKRQVLLHSIIQSGVYKEQIELVPLQKDPPIEKEELKYLLENFSKNDMQMLDLSKVHSYTRLQYCIIIKLFTLLGLKPQKLYDIKICDYDLEHNKIRIPNSRINDETKYFWITLPNALHDQIRKLIEFKLENGYTPSDLLLTRSKGTPVDPAFISYYLKSAREGYEKKALANGEEPKDYSEGNNTFTQTGLQKYGLIEMLKINVNPTIIREFSYSGKDKDSNGFKDDILDNCQNYVFSKELDKSSYLDAKIRAIPTFGIL